MCIDMSALTDWSKVAEGLGGTTGKAFDEVALAQAVKARVFGQEAVIDEITAQMKYRIEKAQVAGGKLPRPLGVFLLAGPARTGKSLFFKVLGEQIYDGKGYVQRLDMVNFSQPASQGALFGAAAAYGGGKGQLTSTLQQNPKTLFELEAFERTHAEIARVLAEGWKTGGFTDAHSQERVSNAGAFFFLTTTVAAEALRQIDATYKENRLERQDAIAEALAQAGFSPDVIARIDSTFVFEPLNTRSYARMAASEIQQVVATYGLTVSKIDEEYLFGLVKDEAGRGGLMRDLGRRVEIELGDQFLNLRRKGATSVVIGQENGRPVVRDSAAAPPA